jgi:hypothetical protein
VDTDIFPCSCQTGQNLLNGNQSSSQSISQSTNESVSQWISQSVSQSSNHASNESVSQSKAIKQASTPSYNHSITDSITHSSNIKHSTIESIHMPAANPSHSQSNQRHIISTVRTTPVVVASIPTASNVAALCVAAALIHHLVRARTTRDESEVIISQTQTMPSNKLCVHRCRSELCHTQGWWDVLE